MKSLLARLPGVGRILKSRRWRAYRHRISLRKDRRQNSTFTGFIRLPTQFEALTGPVACFLLGAEPVPLKILSVGCSNGAEAYTAASVLHHRHPGLEFSVEGLDIDPAMVAQAIGAAYDGPTDVFNNKRIPAEFVAATFDVVDGVYRIKEPIRRRCAFALGDALDAGGLARLGKWDVVFAQNFLFHLPPKLATVAMRNVCDLLAERAALFVDGTDLPVRVKVTREFGLEPLDYRIEQIHAEARWARAAGWPQTYWGLEPFSAANRSWRRRYATIFLRDASSSLASPGPAARR